jgi:hypothetical protein
VANKQFINSASVCVLPVLVFVTLLIAVVALVRGLAAAASLSLLLLPLVLPASVADTLRHFFLDVLLLALLPAVKHANDHKRAHGLSEHKLHVTVTYSIINLIVDEQYLTP